MFLISEMGGGAFLTTTYLNRSSVSVFNNTSKLHGFTATRTTVQCSSPPNISWATEKSEIDGPLTGGAFDFTRATTSLAPSSMSSPKKVTLLRHGLSSWNADSRIQGSSDLSVLTEKGMEQAERCRLALESVHFDQCFSSPVSRAKSTAEILWQGREEPLIFLDIYPIRELWETATDAWRKIWSTPGDYFLVVTHKSILRALVCTALGLGSERFRATDVNNGGLCVFNFNSNGEEFEHDSPHVH